MSHNHIIISQDNILRQLVCGVLRKKNLNFTEAQELTTEHSLSSAVLVLDIGDDDAAAFSLWNMCQQHDILKRAIFIISQEHTLYGDILEICGEQRVLPKPFTPDALYHSLDIFAPQAQAATAAAAQPAEPAPAAPPPQASAPPAAPAIPVPESAEDMQADREAFMQRTLDLSFEKMRELRAAPFAAVIVKNNKIIAEGWSEVVEKHDPTAHAEINAIRKACEVSGDYKLRECEIYCSTEPCPMCLAAIYLAGISKVYYANSVRDAEEFGFGHQDIAAEIAMDRKQRIIPSIQMMDSEAYYALQEWQENYSPSGGYAD